MKSSNLEFELIWNCAPRIDLPHFNVCRELNPDVKHHVCTGIKHSTTKEGWRNCDRNIRNWWKANSRRVKAKKVLIFEPDVYCNMKININFPDSGVSGRDVWLPKTAPGFPWFREKPMFPEEMRSSMCALAPMAVTLWDRDTLDALCDSSGDGIYAKDMFSEVRVATFLKFLGFKIQHAQGLANANYMPRSPDEGPSIYHSIKKEVKN